MMTVVVLVLACHAEAPEQLGARRRVSLSLFSDTRTSRAWQAVSSEPRFTNLLSLNDELVFAYSRISGDGRMLVYSSEPDVGQPSAHPANRILHVYDLTARRMVFETPGIDGYWSPDARHLVYKARATHGEHANIWHRDTGQILTDIMPVSLGDYYSWGEKDGTSTLVTIDGWFVNLHKTVAVSSPSRVPRCPDIGRGARPLVSRDGRRISVFVGAELVLRNLRDCANIQRTGIVAAKADWSADGRYVAFHTAKEHAEGYDLGVIDTVSNTFRRIRQDGSAYFPSWTDDQALVFRSQRPGFHGFVRADDVLTVKADAPAPTAASSINPETTRREWTGALPEGRVVLVLLWAASSARPEALREFRQPPIWPCARTSACVTALTRRVTMLPSDRYSTRRGLACPVIKARRTGSALLVASTSLPPICCFRLDA